MGTVGGSQVDRIIINGEYNPEQNDYDIAMMRLSSPITVGGKSLSPYTKTKKGVRYFCPLVVELLNNRFFKKTLKENNLSTSINLLSLCFSEPKASVSVP